MTKPKEVRFEWTENNVGPEGLVRRFVCSCGNVVVADLEDAMYVATHGCGRDDVEYIECDECDTQWDAVWRGLTFEANGD